MRSYCSYLRTWNLKVGCTRNCSERFCLKAKLAAMRCLQLPWNIINQVPDTTESRQKSSEQNVNEPVIEGPSQLVFR